MKHFEFWHPRLFETPYYLYLLARCARHRLPPRFLAKANFALDHGELGLGSKYTTQLAFDQDWFPATQLLDPAQPASHVAASAAAFADGHGFPLILKPDIGAVGKAVQRLDDHAALVRALGNLEGPCLLQAFCPFPVEYGVFFIRKHGVPRITGINAKHFPTVTGNGTDTIAALAARHPRHTPHWRLFLKHLDVARVPAAGEVVRLSFIGSHTLGCMFTDDSCLVTPALERSVFRLAATQPGFNFGRLDVKASSTEAFQDGEFVVMEVNGIASLPTHMFDPRNSLGRAYRIFFEHGRHLVEIANEHRSRPMILATYRELWRRARANHVQLERMHEAAMTL